MLDLSTPQRQSKKSILLYLIKGIRGLIAYFVFGFFGSKSMGQWYFLGFSIFIAAMALVGPFIRYYFFKFHIENDEFIIKKGWLQKENKAVPLERIQSININQNLIQRILGIASLEVETAGSKAKELEIPGLEKDFAYKFKELLDEKKYEVIESNEITDIDTPSIIENTSTEEVLDEPIAQPPSNSQPTRDYEEEVVMDLSIFDLIKVGLTQNHLKSGFVALGVIFGFWYKIKDFAEEYFGEYTDKVSWESTVKSATLNLLLVMAVVFIIVSIMISVIQVFNKFWGFKIVKKRDYLEVSMGLLNRAEIKIPLNKIQLLEFHSNPLRRILGFHTGKIFQAQSENNKLSSVNVPACKQEVIVRLQELIFNEVVEKPTTKLQANPWSHARLQFYITGTLASTGAIMVWFFGNEWMYIPIVFLLIFSVFMAYQYGIHSRVERDDSFITFYKGWLFKSVIISPIFKTQAVERWRSIFLKRRRETHITIHTAAGSRGLKYLKDNQVTRFMNQVNNQVLVDNRKWM